MRKIKKFKIPVYSYDIFRKTRKAGVNLELSGLGAERDFKEYVSLLASALEPAVVFDYFPPDDPDISVLGSEENAPLTIGALTLGKEFAEKLAKEQEADRKTINEISAASFLSSAVKVISDLAKQEAMPEGFELNNPVFLYSRPEIHSQTEANAEIPLYRDELLSALIKRLEAEKIGIVLQNGNILPEYSCVFCLAWIIKKKK